MHRQLLRLDSGNVAAAEAATRAVVADLADDDGQLAGETVARIARALARSDFDVVDDAELEITVTVTERGVAISVSDHGLPGALSGDVQRGLIDELHLHGAAESVRVTSDGTTNRVTASLRTRADRAAEAADPDTSTDVLTEIGPLHAERLAPEHLESLARCVWRAYGPTYVANFLYHPDETWALVEAGKLHSVVVLDDAGDVVGHAGIELTRPGDRVGDATLALSDPRYRGHHLMREVGGELFAIGAELGLVGSLAEAVTPHTITQRMRVEGGAVETGLLLGFIPDTMAYRGFPDSVQGHSRQSAVLSYQSYLDTPPRTVYLPDAYRDLLAGFYDKKGLVRTEGDARDPVDGSLAVDVDVDLPRALARIDVVRGGDGAADVVDGHRRHLCARGTQIVHVEYSRQDPSTPPTVAELRRRGFAYAGLIPNVRDADVLRLQYLDVEVDAEIISLYTDDARGLLDLALDELR
jgi:hypothetical protein